MTSHSTSWGLAQAFLMVIMMPSLVTSQQIVKTYRLLESREVHQQIQEWKTQYPGLLNVTTAQERYGLDAAGGEEDCPFYEEQPGCPNYILEIQDYIVHPPNSYSSDHLPEVFWSGCLHGNERVGPTAVMEAVGLLLEAAHCEAMPRTTEETAIAKACRKTLKDKGIDDAHRKWLARLVTTRRIVVVPTTNALGYFRNVREEGSIDPNRDFPYDLTDRKLCMQTIAGRTVNEIFREHMFQLALTFHAGMEVVGYEWGAPTWLNRFSPDDVAQEVVASAYSRYGGGWSKSKPYQYGTMNDLVYYVRGGMEDWGYAGSWDPERVVSCQPTTHGGYPAEKTIYNNSTLRVFNMLVETSDQKEPHQSNLGTSLDVMESDTTNNGHVSRNIRLSLLAAELVEPYVSVVGIDDVPVQDDLPPLVPRDGRTCQRRKAYSIAKDAKQVDIQFTVGGSLKINSVNIWYAKWEDIPQEQLDCISQPSSMDGFQKGIIISANNGTGYFSRAGSHPRPDIPTAVSDMTMGPIFKAHIDVPSGLKALDKLVILASARVDQNWANSRPNIQPEVPPQSHVVNARTNPAWHHESAGKHVKGRLDWFSDPITIVIGDFVEGVGTHGEDGLVQTVEMYSRFSEGAAARGIKPKPAATEAGESTMRWYLMAGLVGIVGLCLFVVIRRRQRSARAWNVGYSEDDGFTFDSKPYSDVHADNGDLHLDDEDDELDDDDLNDGVELSTVPRVTVV